MAILFFCRFYAQVIHTQRWLVTKEIWLVIAAQNDCIKNDCFKNIFTKFSPSGNLNKKKPVQKCQTTLNVQLRQNFKSDAMHKIHLAMKESDKSFALSNIYMVHLSRHHWEVLQAKTSRNLCWRPLVYAIQCCIYPAVLCSTNVTMLPHVHSDQCVQSEFSGKLI